jgi:hypothetical protein
MSETSAGSIIGTLRLTITDFETNIGKAQALADHLDGKNVNVDVNVNSGGAETKLAAVAASEDKVDAGNKKIASSSNEASKGLGLMSMAIVGLGPAIVPLAAGAAGLAVGFGAMGAAGILALVGIKEQMAAGTPLGAAYTSMVGTLTGDLHQLGATAAAGVLGPFQTEVANLQGQMPQLNSIIGEFSVITGKTAGNLMSGLVQAFIALEPLARDVGVYVLDLSSKFAAAMSGPGVVSFGDYIRSVFPQVMQTVESIVTAAVHFVAALAPLGSGTLSEIKLLSDVINALPVDVLSTLATVGVSVYLGFKSFSLLSTGITAVGVALKAVGMSAETAAAGMLAMNIAAGVVGVLITAATLLFSAHAAAVQGDQDAINSLTDALIANGGVISENDIAQQAHTLALNGTLAAAKLLGYSMADVTLASMGNGDAMARVTAHTNDLVKAYGGVAPAALAAGKSLDDGMNAYTLVNNAVKDGATNLDAATLAYDAYNAATAKAAVGGNAVAIAQQKIAAGAGTTTAALALAASGQSATAIAAQNAAAKMYVENDAAGILKASLDLLNGKALGLMEAQTADADATNKAAIALKANGKAIDGNSASAILNQQVLQQKAQASQTEAEAVGKATGSTVEATKAYGASKTALEGALRAQGLLTPAVQAYIDKLYDVKNLKLTPTQLDVTHAAADASIVDFQARITAIKQGKVPGIDANTVTGRAAIDGLRAYIDALKQGKVPPIDANATPGQAAAAGLQIEINAIRQGKVPGLAANSKAAQSTIADLQAQLDALHGKTIPVEIQYTANGVNLTAPSSVGRRATGGPIGGVGTGTSDSNLILASKGEHMLTDDDVKAAGGHDAIYAWRKSLHGGGGPSTGRALVAGVQALAAGGPVQALACISPDSQVNSLKKVLS